MEWIFCLSEENTASAICISCEDFDGEVWFIGLARRNVRWTFRQPNARRAEAEKTSKPNRRKH